MGLVRVLYSRNSVLLLFLVNFINHCFIFYAKKSKLHLRLFTSNIVKHRCCVLEITEIFPDCYLYFAKAIRFICWIERSAGSEWVNKTNSPLIGRGEARYNSRLNGACLHKLFCIVPARRMHSQEVSPMNCSLCIFGFTGGNRRTRSRGSVLICKCTRKFPDGTHDRPAASLRSLELFVNIHLFAERPKHSIK